MSAAEQNNFSVRVIRARPIEPHPQLIAFARARGTNVCMRVVSVDAPSGENPFGESIFAGTPDVIHDLALAIFDDGFPNSRREIVEHIIPTNAFPIPRTALTGSLQRIKNAIRIVDLIERRRPFSAVTSTASRILGIAFELLNLIRVFVDVGEQPARRL